MENALIHPDSSGNMQIPIKFLLYETMVKAGAYFNLE